MVNILELHKLKVNLKYILLNVCVSYIRVITMSVAFTSSLDVYFKW